MVQLTVEQRIFVVASYFETKSLDGVCRLFQIRCPDRLVPTLITIWHNIKIYHDHGTCLNRNTTGSGRPRSIDKVKKELKNNRQGVPVRNNGLSLSGATFWRILKKHLEWHPYKDEA